MSHWFLFFLCYSFLGFCLEKLFARAVHAPQQTRKCFLLLPLCPVYGLAMVLLLALTGTERRAIPLLLLGALVCTGTEYLVHLFYDRALHVRFWDYSDLRGNLRGRVCPQFSVIWGLLSSAVVAYLHPAVERLASAVPPPAVFALWLLLAVDSVLSAALLLQYRDPELLALPAFFSQIRASSQSSTS